MIEQQHTMTVVPMSMIMWALALEYLDTNGDNMVDSGELTQLFGTLEISKQQ